MRAIIELQNKNEGENNGVNAINTNVKKERNPIQRGKFWSILKNILLCMVVIIAAALVLVVLYQMLKFLFVAAILLIAWLGVPGRR